MLKWRPSSRTKWRLPPELYGGYLRFVKRMSENVHEHHRHHPDQLPRPRAPSAPTPGATTRRWSPPRATPSPRAGPRRRWRRSRGARRSGSARSTATSPRRQALLEAVYVDEVEALCRSAADLAELPPWEALVGLAAPLRRPTWPPSRRSPRSCWTTSTATPTSSRAAAPRCTPPASRCSSAPSRPASCAPTPTSPRSSRWSAGSPRSPTGEPGADRPHPRHRARRAALPSRHHLAAERYSRCPCWSGFEGSFRSRLSASLSSR